MPAALIAFQGSDPRLKGHVIQCQNESGRNSNQLKKTVIKIKDIFSFDHDADHLLEVLFCLEDAWLTDPVEPADDASKAKLV